MECRGECKGFHAGNYLGPYGSPETKHTVQVLSCRVSAFMLVAFSFWGMGWKVFRVEGVSDHSRYSSRSEFEGIFNIELC